MGEQPDLQHLLGIKIGTTSRFTSWRRRVWWALPVVAVLLLTQLWLGSSGKGEVKYQTEILVRGDLTVTVTATGNLKPTNQVDVGSELSGIVKTVEADFNQQVKVGQVLARLDTSRLEAQIAQSQAALESARAMVLQAQASVVEARTDLGRVTRMLNVGGGIVSQADVDKSEATLKRAEANLASAEADVLRAQAALKVNQTDLTKAVIRAPINGIVLDRAIEPGQTVAASFQAPVLFTLAEDLSEMELHVDVDEADVGDVRTGQTAHFTVDAWPNRSFTAEVTQVRFGAKTVDGVVTYETVMKVDNKDQLLRPGMTATADLTVRKIQNALLLPNAALRFSPPQNNQAASGGLMSKLMPRPPRAAKTADSKDKKQQKIWLLHTDNSLQELAIAIGASDGKFTEITGGELQPGMAVVVNSSTTP